MRGIGAWVLLAGLAAGCGSPTVGPARPDQAEAVELRLEGVTARQYRGAELRLEFQADRLVLDEQAALIQASGQVRGRLAPGLWRQERP